MGDDNLTPADRRQMAEVERWAQQLMQRGKSPYPAPGAPAPGDPEAGRGLLPESLSSLMRNTSQPRGMRTLILSVVGCGAALLLLLLLAEAYSASSDQPEKRAAASVAVVAEMSDNTLACCMLAISFNSDVVAARAASSSETTSDTEEDARREYKHLQAIPSKTLRRLAVEKGIPAGVVSGVPLTQLALRCSSLQSLCSAPMHRVEEALRDPGRLLRGTLDYSPCLDVQ